jgi:2-polyprenyl-3-methyl-5-hydroxy-6-metoxy-1,4-benzoquinol methylase
MPPITNDKFSSDAAFDTLYSLRVQQLSSIHWTPIEVAKRAAAHLTGGAGKNILDIGSGAGKFCIIAAHNFPDHIFYGVEQRKALIDEAIIAQNATSTLNAKFIHANFNELDMERFDHFYFYNSFSENLFHYKPIDNLVQASAEIYEEYLAQFYSLLDSKPPGTRLATFHCPDGYVPPAYKRIRHSPGEMLSLWIKQ